MNPEIRSSASIAAEVAPPTPPLEVLTYSVTETARVLGVSLPTVYRLIARRLLKPLPGLRHKRVSKRQVHAYRTSELVACLASRKIRVSGKLIRRFCTRHGIARDTRPGRPRARA